MVIEALIMSIAMLTAETAPAWCEHVWRDPVGYSRAMFDLDLWSRQREVIEALRDHSRVAVPSCNAAGKSLLAAVAAHWYSESKCPSYTVITGASWPSIEKIVWPWIHKLHARAKARGEDLGGTLLATEWRRGLQWGVFSVAQTEPERFAGFRTERGCLVIVDEASALDAATHEAITGLAASQGSRLLYIGNPLRRTGAFADVCKSDQWRVIPISAMDTPNVVSGRNIVPGLATREWVEERRQDWGEGSPAWYARVLGEFPPTGVDQFFHGEVLTAIWQRDCRPPIAVGALTREGETVAFRESGRGPLRVWAYPTGATNYVIGADVSAGQGASNSTATVLDVATGAQVAQYADARVMPHEFAQVLADLGTFYGGQLRVAFLAWEANGPGLIVGRELLERVRYAYVYWQRQEESPRARRQDVPGWHSSRGSKELLLNAYRTALATGRVVIRSSESIAEADRYLYLPSGGIGPAGLTEESDGAQATHGDRVIGDAVAYLAMQEQPQAKPPPRIAPEHSVKRMLDEMEAKESAEGRWA